MSIELSNVLVTQFAEEVKHRFQEQSVLRDTVRMRDSRGAKTVEFKLMGRGLASERSNLQTPLPVMDVTHTPIPVSVSNWTASELTDIFLDNQTNFDEQQELVQTISMSLGRRMDQIIIDALVADSFAKTVANDIGGTDTNLNVAKLREAAKLLDQDGVPDGDRTMIIHPDGLHALLGETETTSSDFNTVQALVRGDLDTFYGFKFKKIGNRDEGGLPVDGSLDRTNFAYHKSAVAMAMNMDVNVRIDWDSQFGAHRVTGYMSAGSVVIDDTGVVELTTRES